MDIVCWKQNDGDTEYIEILTRGVICKKIASYSEASIGQDKNKEN
jgi:hypothetical protein